jgi:hypothetical protein
MNLCIKIGTKQKQDMKQNKDINLYIKVGTKQSKNRNKTKQKNKKIIESLIKIYNKKHKQ